MEAVKLAVFFLAFLSLFSAGQNTEDKTSLPFLIPKVEVHAHLHGSIRQSTLAEFARSANDSGSSSFLLNGERDLNKCFGLFQSIHSMIQSKETVLRVLIEVLEDFMSENVIYLELRSTPRMLEDGTTKLEYIDLLVSTIEIHNKLHGDQMLVRLLISIDRSKTLEENEETVKLALRVRTRSEALVGIDLSGNPLKGSFVNFVPMLQKCRNMGMFVTVHTAEVPDTPVNDFLEFGIDSNGDWTPSHMTSETDSILSFWPDRLGHALHLQPRHTSLLLTAQASSYGVGSARNEKSSASRRPPIIEICPSSNSYTLQLSNLTEHPTLGTWIATGYPIAISTDDSGVFATTLSEEFSHVQKAFNLSTQQIITLAGIPIDYIFAPNLIPVVREMFHSRLKTLDLTLESPPSLLEIDHSPSQS